MKNSPVTSSELRFERAGEAQTDDVLRVLDEAAGWLQATGIRQWPGRFEPAWVEQGISRGETWLVRTGRDGTVAATFTLDWADPLWSDVPGGAGYLHRIAVRPSHRGLGLGPALFQWAAATVRQHDRHALRLDCVASNHRLRAYYEAAGFVHREDREVGGAPGQHLAPSHCDAVAVSRYELLLDGAVADRIDPLKATHPKNRG